MHTLHEVKVVEPQLTVMTALSRDRWAPNSSKCSACEVEFTLRYRRHHCRSCGSCVCANCSKGRVMMQEPSSHTSNKVQMFGLSCSMSGRSQCTETRSSDTVRAAEPTPQRVCDNCISGSRFGVRSKAHGEAAIPVLWRHRSIVPAEVSVLLPRVSRTLRQQWIRGMIDVAVSFPDEGRSPQFH